MNGVISKKKYKGNSQLYCNNCGRLGHLFKHCKDPITSYGVIMILLSTNEHSIIDQLITSFKKEGIDKSEKIKHSTTTRKYGLNCNTQLNMQTFCNYKNNIKFLLIRRRHTLGYIEFIRGRYNIDNTDGIIFLFSQMTPEEITRIGTFSFDDLWKELWDGSKNKNSFHQEYISSKTKFEQLKYEYNDDNMTNLSASFKKPESLNTVGRLRSSNPIELCSGGCRFEKAGVQNPTKDIKQSILGLDFYVNNVRASWNYPEWGFPKGRRNHKENDLDCGLREFQEETGFLEEDYILLDRIAPLEEIFIGTNGITYRHVYFLAISVTDKVPKIDDNDKSQSHEIGDIGWHTYEEAINLIRPYHIERKKLLTEIYMYTLENIIEIKQQQMCIQE